MTWCSTARSGVSVGASSRGSTPQNDSRDALLQCRRSGVRVPRLAARHQVKLGELTEEPFVDGPADWGIRLASDAAFLKAGVHRQVRFEINGSTSLVEFVQAGLAVALLPPSMPRSP